MDPFLYVIVMAMVAVTALWLVTILKPSKEGDDLIQSVSKEFMEQRKP